MWQAGGYKKRGAALPPAQIGLSREAPAMFKHEGVYFMLTSACTGWNPNRAEVFYARCGALPPPFALNPNRAEVFYARCGALPPPFCLRAAACFPALGRCIGCSTAFSLIVAGRETLLGFKQHAAPAPLNSCEACEANGREHAWLLA